MTVALIIFGLLGFTACVALYLVELALHLERNPEPVAALSVEELLELADGPQAGVVIDLAEHQFRRTDERGEGFDDVA